MRKSLIVMSLLAMASTAEAAQRHYAPNRIGSHYVAPRHVTPRVVPRYVAPRYIAPRVAPRYVAPRPRNWVPGAVIGLGIAGAAGSYYYNAPECWREPVLDVYGRQAYDAYGRPMVDTVCH